MKSLFGAWRKGWAQRKSQRLFDRGMKALEDDDFELAYKIGEKLYDRRFSGAFEVLGSLFLREDDLPRAVSVLSEGVDKFPQIEILWSLLGEAHSNLKEYDQAESAFKRLVNSEVFRTSAMGNLAIVKGRQGKPEEGLALLEAFEFGDRPDDDFVRGTRIWLLVEANRPEEAIAFYNSVAPLKVQHAMAMAQVGRAYLQLGDLKSAEEWSFAALREGHAPEAFRTIRDARNIQTGNPKFYRVQIEGTRFLEELSGEHGFFTTYWVKAESEKEILEYVAPFEPDATSALTIARCELVSASMPQGPNGVVSHHGGYAFFPIGNPPARGGALSIEEDATR